MNKSQAYAAAIDLIVQPNIDFKQIVLHLAKTNPVILMRTIESMNGTFTAEPWMREVLRFLAHENVVGAIKEVRTRTGYGLKEAKDVVDNVRAFLNDRGIIDYATSYPPGQLYGEQIELATKLSKVGEAMSNELKLTNQRKKAQPAPVPWQP
jgi:hypothetical protein